MSEDAYKPFPKRWVTHEDPPRMLTAKGLSMVDGDCLVAYEDGTDKPLWILWDRNPKKVSPVIGLEKVAGNFIYAGAILPHTPAGGR